MNFRLKNGAKVFLLDEEVAMSSLLMSIRQEVTITGLFRDFLKTDDFALISPALPHLEKQVQLSTILTPKTRLHCLELLRMWCNQPSSEVISAIETNFELIFQETLREISFLPDKIFCELVSFMRLPHSNKDLHMFAGLADIFRQSKSKIIDEIPLDSEVQPFLNFYREKEESERNLLLRAACQIGLQPFIDVAGLCIAESLVMLSEDEVRVKYSIPERFSTEIMRKFAHSLPVETLWASLINHQ